MISTKDIAWLAGILEGEGYFELSKSGYGKYLDRYQILRIGVTMSDQDVIIRAKNILGAPSVQGPYLRKHFKPLYRTQVSGPLAIQWMMTLYVFMGARRREKIREIIKSWKSGTGLKVNDTQGIPKEIWDLINE